MNQVSVLENFLGQLSTLKTSGKCSKTIVFRQFRERYCLTLWRLLSNGIKAPYSGCHTTDKPDVAVMTSLIVCLRIQVVRFANLSWEIWIKFISSIVRLLLPQVIASFYVGLRQSFFSELCSLLYSLLLCKSFALSTLAPGFFLHLRASFANRLLTDWLSEKVKQNVYLITCINIYLLFFSARANVTIYSWVSSTGSDWFKYSQIVYFNSHLRFFTTVIQFLLNSLGGHSLLFDFKYMY